MCCAMALSGCAKSKFYERHVEPSYDAQGQPRPGYATLNLEFLDAIQKDLDACYEDKRPQ